MKNRIHFCNQEHLSEIDGYMELGMEEEALSIIRATFDKHEISEEEFHTCVFALLQSERPETWKNLVKTAYRQLSEPVDDQVRSAMLNYYFSVGEAARAFEFFPRRPTKFFDAWTMMQVCLELGRLDEAKKVARYCSGFLATADDDFTKASMADALAAYYVQIGESEQALKLWNEAPTEPAFQRQRLTGIVKTRLVQALEAAKVGLATIAEAKDDADLSIEPPLSNNTSALMSDTDRELKDWVRAIERLIAEANQPTL